MKHNSYQPLTHISEGYSSQLCLSAIIIFMNYKYEALIIETGIRPSADHRIDTQMGATNILFKHTNKGK